MEPILYSEGFPLETLLRCYFKNSRRLYINYFEEFKLLHNYLAPISHPTNLHPRSDLSVFVTYETQEISRILGLSHPTILIQVLLRTCNYGPLSASSSRS